MSNTDHFDFKTLEKHLNDLITEKEVVAEDYKTIRPPPGRNGATRSQTTPTTTNFSLYQERHKVLWGDLYNEYEANKRSRLFTSMCTFCKQNCEHPSVYLTHNLKGNNGVVQCPILRKYVCPKCNATGDKAHTLKYCPLTSSQPNRRAFHIAEAAKLRMSNGRKRI